jgi:hypothetical protein
LCALAFVARKNQFFAQLARILRHPPCHYYPQSSKVLADLTALVNTVRIRTVAIIVVFVAISGYIANWFGVWGYAVFAINPNGSAIAAASGPLARAESAQSANEIIHYLTTAKAQLPESGRIAWWSDDKGGFEQIHTKIDELIIRATNISELQPEDDHYASELYAIHREIKLIQLTLIEF